MESTMGLLVDGKWQDKWYDTASTGGRFVRAESQFRNWVTSDGSPGPSGRGGFSAESGRYHLYLSYACPWAHRALIVRGLEGLEDHLGVSVVHPIMLEEGWTFDPWPGATGDRLHGSGRMYELYQRAKPDYTGRVTVPVLWDKETATIVSNESAEIVRMLDGAFDGRGSNGLDLYPSSLRARIDEVNADVYDRVNNGVYKAGFATTQAAYEEAVTALFDALDALEERLGRHRYLVGDQLTEADIRLFTTLVRFDPVYVGHFKCNLKRLVDYPNLWGFTRDIYQLPGVATTVHMDHIKTHYYASHRTINPTGIVPKGPTWSLNAPHGRG